MTKFRTAVMVVMYSVLLAACNQSTNMKDTAARDSLSVKSDDQKNDIVYQDSKLDTAFKSYIMLKNALIASDVTVAQQSANKLSEVLSQIEGCRNTASIAERVSKSQNLDEQRKDFTLLSDDLIPLMKHADIKKGSVYVQYCPMANSGKGGYWMASSKEIRNPYYGAEMLNCGEVKEVYSKK